VKVLSFPGYETWGGKRERRSRNFEAYWPEIRPIGTDSGRSKQL